MTHDASVVNAHRGSDVQEVPEEGGVVLEQADAAVAAEATEGGRGRPVVLMQCIAPFLEVLSVLDLFEVVVPRFVLRDADRRRVHRLVADALESLEDPGRRLPVAPGGDARWLGRLFDLVGSA